MALLDFLKKKKQEGPTISEELEVPAAPPTSEELPEFPSEAAPKVKKAEKEVEIVSKDVVEKEEGYAIQLQKGELGEREELKPKPIFVDLQLYKDMLDEVGLIKSVLKENEDALARVAEFKQDEDKEFKKWQDQLLDVQRKLIFADKTLFGLKE